MFLHIRVLSTMQGYRGVRPLHHVISIVAMPQDLIWKKRLNTGLLVMYSLFLLSSKNTVWVVLIIVRRYWCITCWGTHPSHSEGRGRVPNLLCSKLLRSKLLSSKLLQLFYCFIGMTESPNTLLECLTLR